MGEIRSVGVLGCGLMGSGIAQVCAQAGYDTLVREVSDELWERGFAGIGKRLAREVEKEKLTTAERDVALGRLHGTSRLEDLAGCDLVIEAVVEELEVKNELWRALDRLCAPEAIFASNTSSLTIADMAAATTRPMRMVGLHFFNPVPVMKLLEIVRGRATSDEVTSAAAVFAEKLGKTPIIVQDTPGFATSRLGVVLGLEAMRMLEQGVASADDIDRAMELGYNHPMGPLRLTDLVGLDVRLAIADHLHRTFGEDTYRAPELLRQMVAAGKLGKKSGEGFYKWE
jgi:3-hydroxybutyryl-CoA dehydrogenase